MFFLKIPEVVVIKEEKDWKVMPGVLINHSSGTFIQFEMRAF